MRVRYEPTDAAEAVNGSGGLVQQVDDVPRQGDVSRQRRRMEGPVPGEILSNRAALVGREGVRAHAIS
jgi:hypothetical protein